MIDDWMRICMTSGFFNLRNAGVGRYSMELSNALKEDHEVIEVGQDSGILLSQGRLKYAVYTLLELPFKLLNHLDCNVYHACTPMEASYAPKPLTVFVHDLISMLHLEKTETHYASGKLRRFWKRGVKKYFKFHARNAVRRRMQ